MRVKYIRIEVFIKSTISIKLLIQLKNENSIYGL